MVFHRFAFSTAIREGEQPRPFRTRDGAAFGELGAVLTAMGWEYGRLIYNYPYSCMPASVTRSADDGMPSPGPGEWVVLTTRPPIDDERHGDRRTVPCSYSKLEKAIFADLKPSLLSVCARSHVRISERVKGPDFAEGDFKFHQHKDARLTTVSGLAHDKRPHVLADVEYRTVGFFIKKPELTGYGCGLIASFGMGGSETLIWNRLVRERFSAWVKEESCFVVAELDLGPACVPDLQDRDRIVLPGGLVTLDFVKKVTIREILREAIVG
jgi:hypothetical protein